MSVIEGLTKIEWRFYTTVIAAALTFVLTQASLFYIRRLESKRKVTSLRVALAAELRSSLQQNGEANNQGEFKKILDCNVKTINAYTFPSMRREVYEKNCEKIGNLPVEEVEAIVEAYGAIDLWNRFANHLKTEDFKAADDSTQKIMIKYFVDINDDVHRTTSLALKHLKPKLFMSKYKDNGVLDKR